MSKTIYFHVGPHKTGTTVIQKNCMDNRASLQAHGLSYPDLFFSHLGHHKLVDIVRRKDVSALSSEILNSIDLDILLSSENFIYFTHQDWAFIKRELSSFDVKIIYTWRRSSSKMYSLWQESIKQGSDKSYYSYYYADLIRPGQSKQLMQTLTLNIYESVFGKENLIILDYDSLSLSGNLIKEFFDTIGLDGKLMANSEQDDGIKNASLDPELTEIIRCLNIMSRRSANLVGSQTRELFFKNVSKIEKEIKLIRELMMGYDDVIETGDYFVDKSNEKIIPERFSEQLVSYELKQDKNSFRIINSDWMMREGASRLLEKVYHKIIA